MGYPVGPHPTDKQVFQRIVALWNSLPGKRNVVNTRPLAKAAWNTFEALCGSLLTEFEEYGTQYSPEYVRQYIEETITNYGEAWEEYPTRDRDWGLTTFLQGGIDRADNGFDKYTPGMYCLDAFGIAATEPDREIGVEYDD